MRTQRLQRKTEAQRDLCFLGVLSVLDVRECALPVFMSALTYLFRGSH